MPEFNLVDQAHNYTEKENQPSVFQGTFSVTKNDLQPQTSSNNDAKASFPKGYNTTNSPKTTQTKMIRKGTSMQLYTSLL